MFTSLPASSSMPSIARVGLVHELDLAAQLLGRDVVAEAVDAEWSVIARYS